MAGGASGPEAFTLLLRLLMTHFDGVGTEEGYTKLHTFGMCSGMLFFFQWGVSRTYADRYGELACFVSGDGCDVGGCLGGGE